MEGEKQYQESRIEELTREWKEWEAAIILRRKDYIEAKMEMKRLEEEYRKSRSAFNRAYKEWKEVRTEALRAKRRLKSYPYRIRRWAKDNFGKVWNMLEETS